MSNTKSIPVMQQFYDKYFSRPDCSMHSVTSLSGLRSIPIRNELFVSDELGVAPFIKGEFSYFVPEDILVGKKLTDCNKGIITFITKDFKLVMLTVAATSRNEWIAVSIIDDCSQDNDMLIITESTPPQTLLIIIKGLCSVK